MRVLEFVGCTGSPSGNWTSISHVTGRDTHHYTLYIFTLSSSTLFSLLSLESCQRNPLCSKHRTFSELSSHFSRIRIAPNQLIWSAWVSCGVWSGGRQHIRPGNIFTPKGIIQQTEQISMPGGASIGGSLQTCLVFFLTPDEIILPYLSRSGREFYPTDALNFSWKFGSDVTWHLQDPTSQITEAELRHGCLSSRTLKDKHHTEATAVKVS